MATKGILAAIVIFLAALIFLAVAAGLLVDWLWFSSIGYADVFWTVVAAKAGLFAAVFAASLAILWLNAHWAYRLSIGDLTARPKVPAPWDASKGPLLELEYSSWRLFPRRVLSGASFIWATFVALGEMSNWSVALRFIYQSAYGQTDPIYSHDIGFYLFALPAYVAVKNWLLLILFLAALFAIIIYAIHGYDFAVGNLQRSIPLAHGSVLLGLFFAVEAWSYWLERFLLLYNDNRVVVGAAYTDVHVQLPVLSFLVGLALAAAFASFANSRMRSFKLTVALVTLVFGSSFTLTVLVPALFQRFYVKPTELQLETPYLRNNIALTREAYNLTRVSTRAFPAEQGLTYQSLETNRPTIDNIRLWDREPLADTYSQLQEIRTYYKFNDIDVDRYQITGDFYQQVTLSARELDSSLLPANAQTWVNLHLLFTHGNGVVMSPVTRKSAEGLPIFYLKDIPPLALHGGPSVREPRIYFGQGDYPYVITKTSTPEFDYPKGKDNAYASYDGVDGIRLAGIAEKALFAWYFGDVNILLSSYLTPESRILIRRNIRDRVQAIAPFLLLDRDPYVVISDGRLFWIQDAYTTTNWFPYAQPVRDSGVNYIRNSVKAVIDAYNGTVDLYVADPSDPLIITYRRIFPSLFKPLEAMPEELRRHIRYPEDFFRIQADIYRAYHMDTPQVFYNREDLWQFPRQPTGLDQIDDRGRATMAPYYITMRLPGEARAEFFLMLPMTPSRRDNMIAWLAARCDPPDYGKLILYAFPKDKLIYGPFQIEARINQNTQISQQISLWNQMGSRVIRGNLLVVPIDNSILYVSPLYLRAEAGQLPELKRVIAAYGDRLVMEEALPEALAALFKESAPAKEPAAAAAPAPSAPAAAVPGTAAGVRAREALRHYDRAIAKLKSGDWTGFGDELQALRTLLEELSKHPEGR